MSHSTQIPRRSWAAPFAPFAVLALSLGMGLARATPALGQDAEMVGPAETPPPAPAAAPLQFEIGPTVASATWEKVAGRPEIGSAPTFGLAVESVVGPYFGIRLDLGYGTPEITSSTGATSLQVNQYFVDVSLVGRLGLPSLREAGVIPFATLGLGSVIHDPERDALLTRSQSAWEYGAGVDLPLLEHFGARLEWRRADVSLENVFDDGADRGGQTVSSDRLTLGAYVRL